MPESVPFRLPFASLFPLFRSTSSVTFIAYFFNQLFALASPFFRSNFGSTSSRFRFTFAKPLSVPIFGLLCAPLSLHFRFRFSPRCFYTLPRFRHPFARRFRLIFGSYFRSHSRLIIFDYHFRFSFSVSFSIIISSHFRSHFRFIIFDCHFSVLISGNMSLFASLSLHFYRSISHLVSIYGCSLMLAFISASF